MTIFKGGQTKNTPMSLEEANGDAPRSAQAWSRVDGPSPSGHSLLLLRCVVLTTTCFCAKQARPYDGHDRRRAAEKPPPRPGKRANGQTV